MKNIVVLIGSPRKGGNTDLLSTSFINGARDSGNKVEVIYANSVKVHPCLGCNKCQTNGGICVIKDDMQEIYKTLSKSDIIVVATPLYFYGVSAQLKAIIDRLHNPIRHTFNTKSLILLSVCADKEKEAFDGLIAEFKSTLKFFSLKNGGVIVVPSVKEKGEIKGNSALDEAYNLGYSLT